MTVQELALYLLRAYPPDLEVVEYDGEYDSYHEIESCDYYVLNVEVENANREVLRRLPRAVAIGGGPK